MLFARRPLKTGCAVASKMRGRVKRRLDFVRLDCPIAHPLVDFGGKEIVKMGIDDAYCPGAFETLNANVFIRQKNNSFENDDDLHAGISRVGPCGFRTREMVGRTGGPDFSPIMRILVWGKESLFIAMSGRAVSRPPVMRCALPPDSRGERVVPWQSTRHQGYCVDLAIFCGDVPCGRPLLGRRGDP